MDDEVEKLTKTEVKELGFSDRLIEALLPEPELRDNPRYRYAGAPMKLWLKSDVDRAMETDKFKEHLKVREKRSLAARKAAETAFSCSAISMRLCAMISFKMSFM